MDTLFLIVARGGSKGLPGKNIKLLNNRPLISYSIDVAKRFVSDKFICVSSDDVKIIETVKNLGIEVPFVRPVELATDTATTYDVVMHALKFYQQNNYKIDKIVLLQPTSPFRLVEHVREALEFYNNDLDAVISVKTAHGNPYQLLYKVSECGFMEKILDGPSYTRRQDFPDVFEVNGAIYIYNVDSLERQKPGEFSKVKHYLMPEINSIDIDSILDWHWAEFLITQNIVKLDHSIPTSDIVKSN